MVCWVVIRGRRIIDWVYFQHECDAEYVRNSLIHHDGYPADIRVEKEHSRSIDR